MKEGLGTGADHGSASKRGRLSESLSKKQTLAWASVLAFIGMAMAAIVVAQSAPDPALRISLANTNQLQLVITNGAAGASYEIHRTPALGDPWILHMVGAQGQTNFTASQGVFLMGFFKATAGLDWDFDGVPNSADPQPTNSAVSNLVITIDSPAHGTIFH